jgi:hypothetical protein
MLLRAVSKNAALSPNIVRLLGDRLQGAFIISGVTGSECMSAWQMP